MKDFLPTWVMYASFVLPTVMASFIVGSLVVGTIVSMYKLYKTNEFYNYFEEITQICNTQIVWAWCIAVLFTLAGLGVGVPSTHAALITWYALLNFTSVLYIIFVVDYWNLKRKGLI